MAEWERIVDLIQYYPDYLKEIRELKEIATSNKEEILKLYEGSDSLWKDGFIEDAGYQGIKRWESLLGIKPYPGDSLSERRAAVMGQWNRQLPYTIARLHERLLSVLGESGYELYLNSPKCELELLVIDQMYRVLQSVRSMVREMIPANLLFIFAGKYPIDIPIMTDIQNQLELFTSFYPRYNREYLKLDGMGRLDGFYRINGYREKDIMEFYPSELEVVGAYHTQIDYLSNLQYIVGIKKEIREESRSTFASFCKPDIANDTSFKQISDINVDISTDFKLSVEKDLWMLDGTYKTDGTKILDAEIINYSL